MQLSKKQKKEKIKMTSTTMSMPAVRRNQNLSRQPIAKVKMGPVSGTFVIIAMVSMLAFLYLNQVTKTSVFTYETNKLNNAKNALISQEQNLSVEAARLQSINNVEHSAASKGMVAEGKPTYAN